MGLLPFRLFDSVSAAMALLTLQNLRLTFGAAPLLEEASATIEAGERIGLLGRNGTGKTTLLRILAGETSPDAGEVRRQAGARVAMLPQDIPAHLTGTTHHVVASGLERSLEAWQREHQVTSMLSRMSLDPDAEFPDLSAGTKRRVLLARALAADPDVLLLDEPTNHLDLDAVLWLERHLASWRGTLIFVTHDRRFLQRLSQRILEIDRGRLFDWACDYRTFLVRKESMLAAEDRQIAQFDKKLSEEEAWVRRGIRARRTRNEGRVRALEQMRRERAQRREVTGEAKMAIDETERSGRQVVVAKDLHFSYGDRELLGGFSTRILRGDKVGVIGPNGAGKSTLLRVMLGELAPDRGTVQRGTNLQIAYFDQLRGQLDEDLTAQENLAVEHVTVGRTQRHVLGYLQDFLFSPDRARLPVRVLSGGERNRLLLAKLFARPANVIVMDEPTNDLDIETLELLEQRLVPFEGVVIVVSHDREFLDNVVTSTIAFGKDGPREYVGGYDDWERQSQAAETTAAPKRPTKVREKPTPPPDSGKPRKLGFKEKRELDTLPDTIEKLEVEIAQLHELMASPTFYQTQGERVAEAQSKLTELERELAARYARWEELSD